jgi:MoxR-like ATPase
VLPVYDEALLRRELSLFPDWYLARHRGVTLTDKQQATLDNAFNLIVAHNLAAPSVFVHRDFMTRNLMAPTLGTGVSSLPPEGALAALGRPGGGSVALTAGTVRDVEAEVYQDRYLIRRPLLQALQAPAPGAVLLIDEVDRADEPFEAFLLEYLGEYQVSIPEIGTVRASATPVTLLTSNRTRDLHDAVKRRCLYHWLDYPERERELAIVRAQVPGASAALAQQVAEFVGRLRSQPFANAFQRAPGIAESVEWAKALVALDTIVVDPEVVSDTAGILFKQREDVAALTRDMAVQLLQPADTDA